MRWASGNGTHGLLQEDSKVLLVQDGGPDVHRGLLGPSACARAGPPAASRLLPLAFVRYCRLACAAFGCASPGRDALVVVVLPPICASPSTGRLGVIGALRDVQRKIRDEKSTRRLFVRNRNQRRASQGGGRSAIAHLELVKMPSRALGDDFGVEWPAQILGLPRSWGS